MSNNGANLGFERKLWSSADKLRSNMDAAEYKHVVLGLIFLKYISDAFTEVYEKLKKEKDSDPEDVDEYVSRRIFFVPKEARWEHLQANAKKPEIGKFLDEAMDIIERDNPSLKGVLPKNNANFAWVQHFIHHLNPTGVAGFVLANGSMSSKTSNEGEIRKNIINADMADCMVALPSQLFYNTMIPAYGLLHETKRQ